jgi:hypothetical protein
MAVEVTINENGDSSQEKKSENLPPVIVNQTPPPQENQTPTEIVRMAEELGTLKAIVQTQAEKTETLLERQQTLGEMMETMLQENAEDTEEIANASAVIVDVPKPAEEPKQEPVPKKRGIFSRVFLGE